MADLLDELFGPSPSRVPQLPGQPVRPFPAAETKSRLDQIGSGLLGGLGYFGDVLDKTFGGRAVRGALGGLTGDKFNPTELLSVLPLSDTLGITDMKNRVSGKKLLENAGIIDKNKPHEDGFSTDDALGIGAEILTDPSTLFGAAVPRAVLGGLGKGSKIASAGLEGLTGVNPYSYAARQAQKAKTAGNYLFDRSSGGAIRPEWQQLSQEVYHPQLMAKEQEARKNFYGDNGLSPLDDIIKSHPDSVRPQLADALNRSSYVAGETGDIARARQIAQDAGFLPDQIDVIVGQAQRAAERVRNQTLGAEREAGVTSKFAKTRPDFVELGQQQARDYNSRATQAWEQEAADAAKNGLPIPPKPQLEDIPFQDYPEIKYVPRQTADDIERSMIGKRNSEAMSGASQNQIGREDAFNGLGAVEINDLIKNPKMRAGSLEVENELSKKLTGHSAGAMPTAWENTSWGPDTWKASQDQVKSLIQKLASYPPTVHEKGIFNEDFYGALLSREMSAARTTTTGNTLTEGIIRGLDPKLGQVRKIEELQKAGESYYRIPELLEGAGVGHIDPGTGIPIAQGKIAEAMGLDKKAVTEMTKTLDGYGISKDAAHDMLRIGQAWKIPGALQPILDFWDKGIKAFKDLLTYPFPSFLMRNLASGFYQQWRGGAFNPKTITAMTDIQRGGTLSAEMAEKLYPGMDPVKATKQMRTELMSSNVAFVRSGQYGEPVAAGISGRKTPFAGELPSVGGEVRPLSQDLGQFVRGYIPSKGSLKEHIATPIVDSEKFVLAKQGKAAGNAAEDMLRGSHYLEKRLQGMDPASAKTEVMKYQLDYGNLSEFEKQVMKRIFPFYSFSRQNLPPIIQDLATKPAKLVSSIRASSSRPDGEFVPQWIGEGSAINLGSTPEGNTRYLSSLGLNFEDEGVKSLGHLLSGNGSRALQSVLGQAAAPIKFPLEQAMGVQMHTGRKLADLKTSPAVDAAGHVLNDIGIDQPSTKTMQLLSELTSATPFSRFATTAGKLTDERKGAGAKAVNLLTGGQLTDVDVPKTQAIAVRDQMLDLLRGNPNARHFEELSVKPENLSKLSPQEMDAYRLFKSIEAEAKLAAATKKKSQQALRGPIE